MARRFKELASLISDGRAGRGVPASRGEILAALLRKRAAAWQGGLGDLESKLRNQILWSLPVEHPGEEPGAGDGQRIGPDEPERRTKKGPSTHP